MNQVFQVRIYPVQPQESLMRRYFGAYRYIYNYFRSAYIIAYDRDQARFDEDAANQLLVQLVQQDRALQIVDYRVLQGALDDVNADFLEFYQSADSSAKKTYPRKISETGARKYFKIYADADNIRYDEDVVFVLGLGKLDHDGTRIEGTIRQIAVTHPASGQYLMSVFCDDVELRQYPPTGAAVGIVRGDNVFAVASTGKYYSDAPEILELRAQMATLRGDDPDLDSKPLKALRKELAKQNKSFISHLTTHFVKKYDRIYIEGLHPAILNHALLSAEDYLWKSFLEQLEKKADLNERVYLELDPPLPAPGLCSDCGSEADPAALDFSQRWICPDCGSIHRPEINNARNLLAAGERISNYID